ncbi:MAG: hypothetical protein IK081_05670 [Lachnospiraceae bacterium]|nr:hypothetical protein [Lachnospiraceae bacterium]
MLKKLSDFDLVKINGGIIDSHYSIIRNTMSVDIGDSGRMNKPTNARSVAPNYGERSLQRYNNYLSLGHY